MRNFCLLGAAIDICLNEQMISTIQENPKPLQCDQAGVVAELQDQGAFTINSPVILFIQLAHTTKLQIRVFVKL
jgi:hypothetical protein